MHFFLIILVLWGTYVLKVHKILLPDDFLFFIPMYGTIPLTSFGIGEFMNLCGILFIVYLVFLFKKNQEYYNNGFMRKNTVYLIWGKMWNGKTRFLTQFFKDCVEYFNNTKTKIMVMSNWHNGYTDVFYSSKYDFIMLQKEIYLLALHCNFSFEEKIQIEKAFNWYFDFDEETKKFKKYIDKIKASGITIHNVTGWDEFHQYFHSRMAMSNFSKLDGQELLGQLHQTRHSKQTIILASQDTDALDLDFRQIAELEIEVKEWCAGIFYGFNLYRYLSQKYQNLEKSYIFKKVNKVPFWWLNKYLLFKIIERFDNIFEFLQKKLFAFLNKHGNKNIYEIIHIPNPFSDGKLDYNTNFNVDKSISIYKPWTYLKKVIEKFDL